jgi:N-acetylmuramoyl-L-alanine amidase
VDVLNIPPAPATIVVATARGTDVVPVSLERGHPTLAVPRLSRLLPVRGAIDGDWAVVAFADQPFRFLLDGAVLVHEGRVTPLVGGAYVARDTIFVPLQWLSDVVPRMFSEGYRYDPYAARFEEARLSPVLAGQVPQAEVEYTAPRPGSAAARRGFRMTHKVVVDPGHGGRDPGNPGRFLPRGVQEKHITLAIGRRLRDELEQRGIEVVMTRDADVLPRLEDRAPMCRDDCDLFVSIHVNSLPRMAGYENVRGFETYFLDEARTAEAQRVAQMENEALRYETDEPLDEDDPLAFILKDLHQNEYLRESDQLAHVVQDLAAKVHPGRDRGVSQARFAVLGAARRPAILIETGFATNRQDAQFLASATGQQRLAEAIADGIETYLRRYEEKVLAGSEL